MRTSAHTTILRGLILACMMLAAVITSAQTGPPPTACCPEFKLTQASAPCEREEQGGTSPNGDPSGPREESFCRNGTNSLLVTPNLPGYTYAWTIAGTSTGTLTTTGNPVTVTWGTGSLATVTVTITSNADPSCTMTITKTYVLRPGPTASFTIAPNDTVCVNTAVQFANTSVGGTTWTWSFGDGVTLAGQMNPTHTYTSPGTYVVTLTVTTPAPSGNTGHGEPQPKGCPCTSVFRDTIVVTNTNGLSIIPQGCKTMLCPGDTTRYCASVACGPYTWTVNGGSIITPNPSTQQCIEVVWNTPPAPNTWPSVSLSIPASCTGTCGNSATLTVPVVYNGLAIDGPNVACTGASTTFTLPTLPGTLYTWTLPSGGGTINGPSGNNEQITVDWGMTPGTYTVKCDYWNPVTKCGGSSTITVQVRDRFQIYGAPASCVGCTSSFGTFSGSNAIWTVTDQNLNVIAGPSAPSPTYSFTWPAVPGPGTYTVTAAAQVPANWCNPTAAINVTVAPVPVLTQPVGPLTVCPGSTHTYTTTTSIPGTAVQWSVTGPNGSGTIVPTGPDNTTAQITFSGTGPYTIVASQPCANWCISGTSPALTVNSVAPPGPITPTGSVCIDQVVSYSIPSPVAGVTYTWTISPSGAGTVLSGQGGGTVSIQWHGGSNTPPTITVTNCSGSSTSSPITINVPAPIAITASGTLCGPGGMTLTAPSGLTGYQWSTNATSQSITNVVSPGTYTVTALQNGCPVSASYTIPVSPLQVNIHSPGPFRYCPGQPISTPFFYSVVGSPTSFTWMLNGNPIATGTSFTATAPGTYTLQVTQNGCVANSNPIVIVQDTCDTCELTNIGTIAITSPTSGTQCNPVSFAATFTQGNPSFTYSPIMWSFGDGGSATGPTATHTYPFIGIYVVTATVVVTDPATGKECLVQASVTVTIPTVTNFMWAVSCGTIALTDLTQTINTNPITSWSWTVSPGGTFSNPNAQNPTLTVGASGAYTVTLTTTAGPCTTSRSYVINVTLPGPPAISMLPNPGCAGQPVAFSTPAISGGSYAWQFGDSYFSMAQSPSHAYTNPGTYVVTLTTTDANGCTATNSDTITINPVPVVTVTPNPVSICPGSSTALTASGCASCTYQWYRDGVLISGATANPYNATLAGSYHVVATSTTTGCAVRSDTAVVLLLPSPTAKITGTSAFCFGPGGNTSQTLGNIYGNNPAYGYAWSSSSPDIVLTTPTQGVTGVQLTTTTPAASYFVYLTVTDLSSGCSASDTFCIFPARRPNVSVSGGGCAGIPHVLTANVTPAAGPYAYLWSTGETTPTITTSIAGTYSVLVTNTTTGCSDVGFGMITPGPDLSLFPTGCDTLCTNGSDTVMVPLPVNAPPISAYTIQWYDNGNPIPGATSWQLPVQGVPPLAPGLHNLSIIVSGPAPSTCSDTAGTVAIFVEECDSCGCDGAVLEEVGYAIGASQEYLPIQGGSIPQAIKCDSIRIRAGFSCAKPCSSLVVVHMYDNAWNLLQIQSGSPAVFVPTPGMSGTYTFVIFGICGTDTCDTDTIRVKIDCPPEPPCSVCPPDFKKQLSLSMTSGAPSLVTIAGQPFNQINAAVSFNLGSLLLTSVTAQVESFQVTPDYRDCITCNNRPAGWGSITGTSLAGITPINAGLAGDPGANDNSFVNPREVLWQSGSPFTLNPGATTLSFYLPALANVPCCELKGKICVRFYFRDVNCRVCDTLVCFEIGKEEVEPKCACKKWRGVTFTTTPVDPLPNDDDLTRAKVAALPTPLACGATYTVKKGQSFTFNAGYECQGDCDATYSWKLTTAAGGGWGPGTPLTGTGASASVPGTLPAGNYVLTITSSCGGSKCEPCVIRIRVL